MDITKIIRNQSKDTLSNNWVEAITALFMYFGVLIIVFALTTITYFVSKALGFGENVSNLISFITCVVAIILSTPAFNGLLKFFYDLSVTGCVKIDNIFFYFKNNYIKTIIFNIIITLKIFTSLIIFAIIYGICYSFKSIISEDYLSLIFFVGLMVSISYSLVTAINKIITLFLYADDSTQSFSYYNDISKIINLKHSRNIIALFRKFIPLFLLCYLILPVIYILPYTITAFATSGKWLINIYKDGKMI